MQAQYASKDPDYLGCKKKTCQKYVDGKCRVSTCAATLSFHVINIRTAIKFVFYGGGFETPCILKISDSATFANPQKPLYGHLSSTDSTGTSVSKLLLHLSLFFVPLMQIHFEPFIPSFYDINSFNKIFI